MTDELNEFLKELVERIAKKFQETKTRISQLEAKIIALEREIETIKKASENKIDKSILKELE